MTVSDDDLLRLRHMRDASLEVLDFTENRRQADLSQEQMLFRAVTMSIGIIGEAASQIFQEFRKAHPEIPWREIVGMRNYLFHVYHRIDYEVLWQVVSKDVPTLLNQLKAILADG